LEFRDYEFRLQVRAVDCGIQGSEIGGSGLGIEVRCSSGLGFEVWVWGLGCGVWVLGFGVGNSGFGGYHRAAQNGPEK
jgi:hypothetical protein